MQFRYLIFAGIAAAVMFAASAVTPPGTGAANAQDNIIEARSAAMKTLGGSLRRVGQAASAEDARGPAAAIAGAAASLETLFPRTSAPWIPRIKRGMTSGYTTQTRSSCPGLSGASTLGGQLYKRSFPAGD